MNRTPSVIFPAMPYLAFMLWFATTSFSRAGDVPRPVADVFIHPGIAHTKESLNSVRLKISRAEEPWAAAWSVVQRSDYASLRWSPTPRPHVERGAYNRPNLGASAFSKDGKAAYTHALCWALTGKRKHARKSAQILNAWSAKLRTVTNHDAKLLVGMSGHVYCNAAEILKHTDGRWSKDAQTRFESMLVGVWHPIIRDFFPSANGNWDASIVQTLMAMAVFLDDREMFTEASQYFVEGEGNGALCHYINDFGQCQESGRDQAHTQLGLDFLANACEIAWNQGFDLYGSADNRLLKGFEYTAKYNLGLDVPYEVFESYDGRYVYRRISTERRGSLRPMYQRVYHHYHDRMGLDAPFTKRAAEAIREDQYSNGSLPWSQLMFADVEPADAKED